MQILSPRLDIKQLSLSLPSIDNLWLVWWYLQQAFHPATARLGLLLRPWPLMPSLPCPVLPCHALLLAVRTTSRQPVATLLLHGPSGDTPWSQVPWLVLPRPPPLGWLTAWTQHDLDTPRVQEFQVGWKSANCIHSHLYFFYIILYMYNARLKLFYWKARAIFISLWMNVCIALKLQMTC